MGGADGAGGGGGSQDYLPTVIITYLDVAVGKSGRDNHYSTVSDRYVLARISALKLPLVLLVSISPIHLLPRTNVA